MLNGGKILRAEGAEKKNAVFIESLLEKSKITFILACPDSANKPLT